jgi:hypothetical protein
LVQGPVWKRFGPSYEKERDGMLFADAMAAGPPIDLLRSSIGSSTIELSRPRPRPPRGSIENQRLRKARRHTSHEARFASRLRSSPTGAVRSQRRSPRFTKGLEETGLLNDRPRSIGPSRIPNAKF